MANEERDRFGEKLKDAERAREDLYFAEQDRRLIAGIRDSERREAAANEELLCPRCRRPLTAGELEGAAVARCDECRALWVEEQNLKKIASQLNRGWLTRWFTKRPL